MMNQNTYKTALFITLSVFTCLKSKLNAQVLETDSLALVALYNSTDGPNWTDNTNWLTGTVDEWYGVTVNENRVTALSLQTLDKDLLSTGNNLNGVLPAEIGNLSELTQLSIILNENLVGIIPSEVGNLTKLTELDLADNSFTGSIPLSIENLIDLRDINLPRNQLEGQIPKRIFELQGASFISVNLSNNPLLTGEVPLSIINSNISDLDIENTSICTPGTIEYILWVLDNSETDGQSNCTKQVAESDSLALVALYNTSDGANWGETNPDDDVFHPFENWMVTPVSTWEGVFVHDGRVTGLELDAKNLTGNIPEEIGELDQLTYLNLGLFNSGVDQNNLSDSIPETIGNLIELVVLRLSGNDLTGRIPGSITSLNNLKELDLSENQLTGSIPSAIGNLSNLETLGLSGNKLSGNVPSSIGNLTNLTGIFADKNQFSGAIPDSFGELINVDEISFSDNQLSGDLPSSLGNLINLRSLFLDSNNISGNIPGSIATIGSNLPDGLGRIIVLSNNNLQGFIPPELDNLIASLDLSNNPDLVGMIPPELSLQVGNINFENTNVCASPSIPDSEVWNSVGIPLCEAASLDDMEALLNIYDNGGGNNWTNKTNWPVFDPDLVHTLHGVVVENGRVVRLDLNNNNLVGFQFNFRDGINDLTALKYLDLSDNNITYNEGWEFNSFPVLEHFDVSGNEGTLNAFPAEITQSLALKYLDLSDIIIAMPLPTALSNLGNLEYLYLDDMLLTDAIPAKIGSLSNLKVLSMTGNQFSSVPPEIGNLTSLEELYLNNQLNVKFFDTSIPSELGNLNSLKVLFLGGNEFVGSIPSELENLSNLERLGLWSNNLTGVIPAELGNLTSLQQLFLYDNQLDGSIPAELGNLSNLTFLGLYTNQLTGTIPSSLSNLESLELLYLHDNELSGAIPTEIESLSRLQDFWLHTNQLSGTIPESLGNLSNLEDLIVHNNQFTGQLPETIGNIRSLDRITIDRNAGLTGEIPTSWLNLELSLFYFFNTEICESATIEFSSWKSLVSDFQGTDIACENANNPPIIADQIFDIDENSTNGTSVGKVIASDPDDDELIYSVTAGNTGSTFAINSATGEIIIADNTLLDFETNPSFRLIVSIDDGSSSTASASITINIIDVDESPVLGLGFNIEESIYPNPVMDKFKISGSSLDKITLVSLDGKIIRVIDSDISSEYDISELDSGIYLIFGMYQGSLAELGRLIKQ